MKRGCFTTKPKENGSGSGALCRSDLDATHSQLSDLSVSQCGLCDASAMYLCFIVLLKGEVCPPPEVSDYTERETDS